MPEKHEFEFDISVPNSNELAIRPNVDPNEDLAKTRLQIAIEEAGGQILRETTGNDQLVLRVWVSEGNADALRNQVGDLLTNSNLPNPFALPQAA